MGNLGRLEPVDLRLGWRWEARDFTRWLAEQENLELLGAPLDLTLQPETVEAPVGPFSADIVCRDGATGRRVVIENQLEKTNHDHLGKVLTYAAGLDDVRAVIWIAKSFSDEHRAALDWLNDITPEEYGFYGVEVRLWKIGDSLPAPEFVPVSKPNQWSRAVESAGKGQLSDLQRMQFDYWSAFLQYLDGNDMPASLVAAKPGPRSYLQFRMGRSGAQFSTNLVTWDDDAGADESSACYVNRVTLTLTGSRAAQTFATLQAEREEIEREVGAPLHWYGRDDASQRRIYIRKRLGDALQVEQRHDQFRWLHEHLLRFHEVFASRLPAV